MKRTINELLIVFVLLLGSSICLAAQNLSADSFLNSVSAHPVGDEVEQDQFLEIGNSLYSAPQAEVEKVLPNILEHTQAGAEAHARSYATGFLMDIAMRPDGASLLSSSSAAISSLIADADPVIQRQALEAMDYIIGKTGTDNQPYMSALQTALQKTQTPQAAAVEMIRPLLRFDQSNPGALSAVLAFMQRDDLTRSTRIDLVYQLGVDGGLPTEVDQALTKELDDPDPLVRAAAVRAFAESKSKYRILAKNRVQNMASDPEENPQVRELATEAIAGKTHLNPNINPPPEKPEDH